ncbi:MAG: hypothetical protein ABIR92_01715 [Gemmatimonadaceae bacterium]
MFRPIVTGTRFVLVLAQASIVACASTGTPTPHEQSTYIPGTRGAMTITGGSAPHVKRVAAPLDVVWRAIPGAFDSLSIPISLIDPKARIVGNEGFKIRQRMGSTRLSAYIECGDTQGGPNADSYEVYLTVMTQVEAEGATQSKVTTTITAAAKPLQFAQEFSRCSTKDVLEAKIAQAIEARVRR